MRSGFKVGRAFGIDIEIDWSWFFIFLLITWNLSVVFGQIHSDWGTGLRWTVALIASLLFFVSVLAHELAHSLTARAQGVSVRSITMFLFGGVSNIQRQPSSPRAEFLITIVGPVTSIILGFVFLFLSGASATLMSGGSTGQTQEAIAQMGPLTTLLAWLGPINILLGVFNLIPGFPLDGGRILRSILWAITDNLQRATRWASLVGQAIAWLLIVAGIAMVFGVSVPFFGQGVVGGLWLAFIGWFLNSASVQSYRQVMIQDVLEDVPVEKMMRSDPPTAAPDDSISRVVNDHVMSTDDHAFPVVENGQLVGLITLEDVRSVSRDDWETTKVREVMTPVEKLVTVPREEDAADSMRKLMHQDVRQIPVMDNGHLAGLLRRKDIVKWLKIQDES